VRFFLRLLGMLEWQPPLRHTCLDRFFSATRLGLLVAAFLGGLASFVRCVGRGQDVQRGAADINLARLYSTPRSTTPAVCSSALDLKTVRLLDTAMLLYPFDQLALKARPTRHRMSPRHPTNPSRTALFSASRHDLVPVTTHHHFV